MKMLLLTPLNPVLSRELYIKLSEKYQKTNVNVLSFPFFAAIAEELDEREYIPSYFAMIKDSLEPELHKKLYDKKRTLVIGNVYKEEKFDIIVSFGYKEDEIFDNYLEMLRTDKDFKVFSNKVDINNLYSPKDAEINLPTLEHVELFLEGVYK
jgi:hypothetical protein